MSDDRYSEALSINLHFRGGNCNDNLLEHIKVNDRQKYESLWLYELNVGILKYISSFLRF
jgi:hypothetical protein